jgi:shikimate dehydrogenase
VSTQPKKCKSGFQHIFGLIGHPVAHSLSPAMWNYAFAALKFPAVYLAFDVVDLPSAFNGLRALGIKGVNVTLPHKRNAAELCEVLHPPASLLSAVNTIKFSSAGSEGWNTDAIAMCRILASLKKIGSALVLGNGGSAAAVIWALTQNKIARIFQISRKKSKAPHYLTTGTEFQSLHWNSNNLEAILPKVDLIINTTPLGWKNEDRIKEFETKLNNRQIFFDLNYSDCSHLIGAANESGCRIIDGKELLVLQAVESFKLLTDLEAPEKIMRGCIF